MAHFLKIAHFCLGPWRWWSSGQHARLLLQRSVFESRWRLQFLCKIVIWKEQKRCRGWPIFSIYLFWNDKDKRNSPFSLITNFKVKIRAKKRVFYESSSSKVFASFGFIFPHLDTYYIQLRAVLLWGISYTLFATIVLQK